MTKARTSVIFHGKSYEVLYWNEDFTRARVGDGRWQTEVVKGAYLANFGWVGLDELEKENPTLDSNPEWGDLSP